MYERMNDTSTLYVYSTFSFWIVTGMVLYLAGSFFIYIFADSLPKAEVDKYWVVTNVLSILKNIFFTIGIIVNSKPPRKIPPSDFEFSSLN
jgi:Na+-driven multidrug efflux pump